jgi:hypothetical protein
MTEFGEWLRKVPPIKAAVGLLLMLATVSFSLGAASVTLHGIPSRLTTLEVSHGALAERIDHYIMQDSIAGSRQRVQIWRNGCILERMARGETVTAFDCDPDHENGADQ